MFLDQQASNTTLSEKALICSFVPLTTQYLDFIKNAFMTYIEPIYKNQTLALKKLIKGEDRNCEILEVNSIPVGFIVYKTSLRFEFSLENAFELKTLFVSNQYRNYGLGKLLFRRAEKLAQSKEAECIFATVSEELGEVKSYMIDDGWHIFKSAYSDDNHVVIDVLVKWI